MRLNRAIGSILVSSLLVIMTACEIDTRLQVEEENPPAFSMFGSGSLGCLRVRGPKQQRQVDGEARYIYWEILPEKGFSHGTAVNALSPIIYGKVPPGYIQTYPENGEAPPLIEGEKYAVWAQTVSANGAIKYFVIQDGKAVEVQEKNSPL
ncbi:MAG TPA: hypothetical protein VNO70_06900 [Blastocatellia bacterium]|nr:hypothetical protein [Blastocatellia bacterium]